MTETKKPREVFVTVIRKPTGPRDRQGEAVTCTTDKKPVEAVFVIKNLETNKYVAAIHPAAIAGGSYTKQLEEARTFSSREVAQADACENERVYEVSELMMPNVPAKEP